MSHPLLLGHRGARATRSIPENTLASFDLALNHGCDGFEFDVRLTADGRALICHDPKLHGIEIAHAGPEQLSDVCTLDQVLARYGARAFLDIELKVPALETTVLDCLKRNPPQRGYVVSSFLPGVLHELRTLDPDVPLGLIAETRAQLSTWQDVPAEFLIPHYTLIDINLIQMMHNGGRKVLLWTVNGRERMLHCLALGVEGIISDETEILGQLRATL